MTTSASKTIRTSIALRTAAFVLLGIVPLASAAHAQILTRGPVATAYNRDSDGTKPIVVVGGYQSLPGGGLDTTASSGETTLQGGIATAYNRDSDGTKPIVVVGGYQSLPGGGLDTSAVDTSYAGGGSSEPLLRAAGVASRPELGGNAPNPFRSSTAISFVLAEPQQVRLAVYNLLGRQVGVAAEGAFAAGSHTVSFSAEALPSGVYVYRLETESGSVSRRMTLVR